MSYRERLRVIDRPREGEVRLIDETGEQIGVRTVRDALALAQERGYDLVEVAPNTTPPTCKLLDYGKYKYQQRKKQHQAHKQKRRKEIKVRPKTEEHDFMVKVNRARKMIVEGHKVLVTLVFRGREVFYSDNARGVLVRFAKELEDVAKMEKEPRREGRKMDMILVSK